MIILRRVTGGYLVRVHPQVPAVFTSERDSAIRIAEQLYWTLQ